MITISSRNMLHAVDAIKVALSEANARAGSPIGFDGLHDDMLIERELLSCLRRIVWASAGKEDVRVEGIE